MNKLLPLTIIIILALEFCKTKTSAPGQSQSAKDSPNIEIKTINDTFQNDTYDLDSNDYRKRIFFDTTFSKGDNKFKLELKFEFDSSKSVVIPSKYVGIYGLDSFLVYESYSIVRLFKNDLLLLDTAFYKKTYLEKLDSSLFKYGNLMFPEISIANEEVDISHSLSIPMTDVGVSVSSRLPLN